MEGYDVSGATVYSKQGTALSRNELSTIICSVCGLILREAMQVTQCGHRFCKNCIEKILNGSSDEYRCPIDKERFEKFEVRKDRGVQKEIQSLEVDCPTRPDPCTWRGPLVEIEVHRLECPHTLVSCTLKCGLNLRKNELESHLNKECPKRHVTCTYCHDAFPFDQLKSHFLECPEFPVECQYCQLKLPSRKLIENHLENSCANYEIDCPMNCSDFKGKKPDLINHLSTHLLDIVQLLKSTVSRVEILEAGQQESNKTISTLTHKIEEITTENCEMKVKITELEQSLKSEKAKSHKNDEEGTIRRHIKANDKEQNSMLSLNPHIKNGGAQNVSSFSKWEASEVRLNAGVKEQVQSQGTQLLKMSETLQTVQTNLTQYAIAIDEVRLRQDILDVKTTNGLLIWKIPDIRRRYRDAVDRRTISLYSPPFYTSPHGYRMCIRTYLNGDGIGKGTHLSLFFVMMQSEQDNLLPWPFKQSVRFTLINQKNPAASITEAFVPDAKSASFQKPESDMNVASGFPKFASQSVLQDEEFTLGDTIYIKCQIDTKGLKLE